jgi:hypothetical protein
MYRLPYSIVVHAYSNLSLNAYAVQTGFEPGAKIGLHASLAQSGIPLAGHASLWVDIKKPDGNTLTVLMTDGEDGQFTANFSTTIPGVYQCRVRARGTTTSGELFTREKTLTAAVWIGGDRIPNPAGSGQNGFDDSRLCALLQCFLKKDGMLSPELEKRLTAAGLNINHIRECLFNFCCSK